MARAKRSPCPTTCLLTVVVRAAGNLGTAEGVDQFNQQLEVTLFADDEYGSAFHKAGFERIEYDAEGFMGRGMYVGSAPV